MYGLNKEDLLNIQEKHNLQRNYLLNSTFETQSGQVKTLLDVSFSANHSTRYYTELINKINTLNDLMNSDTNVVYKPVFITITLDGFYRGFLYGKFNKYDDVIHKKQVPNNERFGYLRDKIYNKEKFTIKNLYNVLNFQLWNFQKSQIFKDIKANGHKIHYIRVCEPHKKDGVPHLHLMMYVPVQYVDRLKLFYKKYFPAPQNLKPLNKNNDDGQLKGFQFEINSAPAYILKYIFKSFLDVKNQSEIDYLQAWYIKNRILRVVTSHSVIPAWVYRKMIPLEKDWYYLTDIKKYSSCEWSKEDDYIKFEDDTNRILEYDKGIYKLYYKTRLIKSFGTKKEIIPKEVNSIFKLKYKKKIKEPKIIIDGKPFKTVFNPLLPFKKYSLLLPAFTHKPIKYRSNIDLYKIYVDLQRDKINFNYVDLNYFDLIEKEVFKRGILLSLNEYGF